MAGLCSGTGAGLRHTLPARPCRAAVHSVDRAHRERQYCIGATGAIRHIRRRLAVLTSRVAMVCASAHWPPSWTGGSKRGR
ncbi:ribulokinase [Anopheles sinensis]|uniref:Ribulokinase n=1 Tax=Anopheles sinensis TaxID=74873 RepID=A0A084VN11_ANOSI|nr:ribulokinase [Anopheles sinensis]